MIRAKTRIALIALLPPLALSAADNEMASARAAIRDGLWQIARNHAAKSKDKDAALAILESYAGENRWKDIAEATSGGELTPRQALYRALALCELDKSDEAGTLLSGTAFTNAEDRIAADGIRLKIYAGKGEDGKALEIAVRNLGKFTDNPSLLLSADLLNAKGMKEAARGIWKQVLSGGGSDDCDVAIAAANLGDRENLLLAESIVRDENVKKGIALRIANLDLNTTNRFDAAKSSIESIMKSSPDLEGAKEAVVNLCIALDSRNKPEEVIRLYALALEIWPMMSSELNMQSCYANALLAEDRSEEALASFLLIENLSTNTEQKAAAILSQGDIYSKTGNGERAIEKYRLVLERYPDTISGRKLKNVFRKKELEDEGRSLYRAFDFEKARKVFAGIAEEFPETKARMAYFDVLCLYGLNKDSEAIGKARRLLEDCGDLKVKATLLLWLGKIHYNMGRNQEAAGYFAEYEKLPLEDEDIAKAMQLEIRALLAAKDYNEIVRTVGRMMKLKVDGSHIAGARIIQAEALIELSRFDEAILVTEQILNQGVLSEEELLRAKILRADALFAIGADDSTRYRAALLAYQTIRLGTRLSPDMRLSIAFKIGRTLEKMQRREEAIDQYYSDVVLAYRKGLREGVQFGEEAGAAFSRAAFRLADDFQKRGEMRQAERILELVAASDVPSSVEAEKRLEQIQMKGLLK